MSNRYGPRIVTDGLVLCLDAADRNSYPGSGVMWYNLVENNRHYSNYGSVPFLSEVGGCWDFTSMSTGASNSAPLGFTSYGGLPFSSTSSFTISTWLYVSNTSTGQTGLYSNAGSANGVRFGPNNKGMYFGIGPTWKETTIAANSYSANEWVLLSLVYDRQGSLSGSPYMYAYVNGDFIESTSLSAQTAMTTGTVNLVRSSCCARFIGKLSCFSVYNKALVSGDIEHNYKATKGRFGL